MDDDTIELQHSLSPFDKAKQYIDIGNPGYYSPSIQSLAILDWQASRTSPYDMWRWGQSIQPALTRGAIGRNSYTFHRQMNNHEKNKSFFKLACTVFCLFMLLASIIAVIIVCTYFYRTTESKFTQINDRKNMTAFVCQLSLLERWNNNLRNQSSELFNSTAKRFIQAMDHVYVQQNNHYIRTEVLEFSPGSIRVKFLVIFNSSLDKIPRKHSDKNLALYMMPPFLDKVTSLEDQIVDYITSTITERATALKLKPFTIRVLQIRSRGMVLDLENIYPLDRRKSKWRKTHDKSIEEIIQSSVNNRKEQNYRNASDFSIPNKNLNEESKNTLNKSIIQPMDVENYENFFPNQSEPAWDVKGLPAPPFNSNTSNNNDLTNSDSDLMQSININESIEFNNTVIKQNGRKPQIADSKSHKEVKETKPVRMKNGRTIANVSDKDRNGQNEIDTEEKKPDKASRKATQDPALSDLVNKSSSLSVSSKNDFAKSDGLNNVLVDSSSLTTDPWIDVTATPVAMATNRTASENDSLVILNAEKEINDTGLISVISTTETTLTQLVRETDPRKTANCQVIIHGPCLNYGYNYTRMDAQMNTYNQQQAKSMMEQFLDAALHYGCTGPTILHFTCAIFFPKCHQGRVIMPCSDLCHKVRMQCEPFASFLDGLCNSLKQSKACLAENGEEISVIEPTVTSKFIDSTDMKMPEKIVCVEDEFQCLSGHCILWTKRCDGFADCDDKSDENLCQMEEIPELTTAPTTCSAQQFQCPNGTCIPFSWKCDGYDDCRGGMDENFCQNEYCYGPQFRCSNGVCIPHSWRCDRYTDCLDGSDEQHCVVGTSTDDQATCGPELFRCRNNICIPLSWRCDNYQDCADGSDEMSCPSKYQQPSYNITRCYIDQFHCSNGSCIPRGWRCDRERDCHDGSDEIGCEEITRSPTEATKPEPQIIHKVTCGIEQFTCSNGKCISIRLQCNTENDCEDGSDEVGCIPNITIVPATEVCHSDQFQCKDKTCIPIDWRCDQESDCHDQSDEINCNKDLFSPTFSLWSGCQGNQFHCLNRTCIPSFWKCDKEADCPNAMDEKGCIYLPTLLPKDGICDSDHFQCTTNDECVPLKWRCDGTAECTDESDEVGCPEK